MKSDTIWGWKCIQEHMGASRGTILKWVKLGFPLRRVTPMGTVYIVKKEVAAWLRKRRAAK